MAQARTLARSASLAATLLSAALPARGAANIYAVRRASFPPVQQAGGCFFLKFVPCRLSALRAPPAHAAARGSGASASISAAGGARDGTAPGVAFGVPPTQTCVRHNPPLSFSLPSVTPYRPAPAAMPVSPAARLSRLALSPSGFFAARPLRACACGLGEKCRWTPAACVET